MHLTKLAVLPRIINYFTTEQTKTAESISIANGQRKEVLTKLAIDDTFWALLQP